MPLTTELLWEFYLWRREERAKEQRLSWSGDSKASRSRELERGHERGILLRGEQVT